MQFSVEDVVELADAAGVNSFELALALTAVTDAAQDYVKAFETETDRPTLAAEGRELLARMVARA